MQCNQENLDLGTQDTHKARCSTMSLAADSKWGISVYSKVGD